MYPASGTKGKQDRQGRYEVLRGELVFIYNATGVAEICTVQMQVRTAFDQEQEHKNKVTTYLRSL